MSSNPNIAGFYTIGQGQGQGQGQGTIPPTTGKPVYKQASSVGMSILTTGSNIVEKFSAERGLRQRKPFVMYAIPLLLCLIAILMWILIMSKKKY
jgi:uncharacterized membrane protein (UPF0136 family)